MDANLLQITEKRIEKTIKALERNNMEGFYAKDKGELLEIIDDLISGDEKIISGGSMTLEETGVMAHLRGQYAGKFLDRAEYQGEKLGFFFREAFTSDTFFASSNAITENGELYNVDGNGNRVSAMIFGPKQVIIVAGSNKIVPDLKAAEERVKKVAAPANAVRLGLPTACSYSGECMNCHSDSRICCSYVVLGQQREKNRIKVILLADSFGY